ncbi:hypothetical protein [Nocardia sp. IFM 10818]
MTAPNGVVPDGAYVITSKYGSDIQKDDVMGIITGDKRTKYNATGGEWGGKWDELASLAGKVRDGQLDMNNRLDLLESISGYQSLFMGKNWEIRGGHSRWVQLPFDTQLGPNKNAEKFQDGIKFVTRGLWRADCHVTFAAAPSGWGSTAVPATVAVTVNRISDGSVFTEHDYDIVITQLGAETAAFSHTFVIPEDDKFFVKVSVYHPKEWAWVIGGTLRSALSVNRWDVGTTNAIVAPDVPNGGRLE